MYEVIDITTRESQGIFSSYANAAAWVKAQANPGNFRIFPW